MFRRVKVIAGMGNIKYIEVSILRRWSNEYVHIGTQFNVGKIISMVAKRLSMVQCSRVLVGFGFKCKIISQTT